MYIRFHICRLNKRSIYIYVTSLNMGGIQNIILINNIYLYELYYDYNNNNNNKNLNIFLCNLFHFVNDRLNFNLKIKFILVYTKEVTFLFFPKVFLSVKIME